MLDEVKNTIAIPIMSIEEEFIPSVPVIDIPVLIDMPPVVVIAAIGDMLEVVDMSILTISVQGSLVCINVGRDAEGSREVIVIFASGLDKYIVILTRERLLLHIFLGHQDLPILL